MRLARVIVMSLGIDMSEIAKIINRARSAGFLEFYDINDLVNTILKSNSEINAILYRQGSPPVLFNAALEDDYVSLAILDLNLIDEVPLNNIPRIKEDFNRLEDITTELSYQASNSSLVPFLFPVVLDESKGVMRIILGVKTVTHKDVFNEGFIEGLLEDLDFNYEVYFNQLMGMILMRYAQ